MITKYKQEGIPELELQFEKIQNYHVSDVTNLHRKYINTGFLSSLNPSILQLIYKSMIESSNAVCIVPVVNNRAEGFISAAINVKDFYKTFLIKNFLKAAMVLSPNMIRPHVFRKIFETLRYTVKNENDLPNTELLSIALAKNLRGNKIAQRLFEALVIELKNRKIKSFKTVVGSNLTAAVRFYEKMGGVLHSEIELHKNDNSRVYIWKL